MREYRKYRKLLPLLAVFLLISITALVFLIRSPVYVLTDSSFSLLYGEQRLNLQRLRASVALFRRIIPIPVSESAGSDLVVLAVEAAAPSPRMILFPYRYLEGAEEYQAKYPNVKVLVIGGNRPVIVLDENNEDEEPGDPLPVEKIPLYISTYSAEDLYRAGLCAAIFAGKEKRVLFFHEGPPPEEYQQAFRDGLRFQGYLDDPIYRDISADYSPYTSIGCVIMTGAAVRFLENNLQIPVILFSWADPAITPESVKIIFDDSHWALVPEALKASQNNSDDSSPLVSSKPVLLGERIEDKEDFRKLQSLVKEKY